ncbi:flagellar assembly protein T N-terminal domain-containing protein [Litoribacillus peritrichatus]|uniref:flagellar assembly protein T N-terminal domain-containing protein n=1 Tax=Litoribacillus peritrichatus TaxID=718191 RepID=UPI0031E3BA5B
MLKLILRWVSLSMLMVCTSVAWSKTVTGEGHAQIGSDVENARDLAYRRALRDASLQANVRVTSTEIANNGYISHDNIRMESAAEFGQVEILTESIDGNVLTLKVRAEVAQAPMCTPSKSQNYNKRVAVLGFSREKIDHATLGGLDAIERELPQRVALTMSSYGGLRVQPATHIGLYPDVTNAPSRSMPDYTVAELSRIGRDLGVQYVISGVIRDMSNRGDYKREELLIQPLLNWFVEPEPLTRRMSVDVYVYEAYSGALVHRTSYSDEGDWTESEFSKAGFGSQNFWKTDYGFAVERVIANISEDMSMLMNCQPFMAEILQAEGQQLRINAGALDGLRPGDTLTVYRTKEHYEHPVRIDASMNRVQTTVKISQVQPHFAFAEITSSIPVMQIQMRDMVVAW